LFLDLIFYIFLYPPQNVSGHYQELMTLPGSIVAENYKSLFDRLENDLKYPSLF